MRVDLLLSSDTLDALHKLADTKKKAVSVNSEALRHLLIDFGKVCAALSSTVTLVEPGKRERPSLDQ